MEGQDHFENLMTQLKIIKDRIRGIVHGQSNGMYLHGRPGTMKTHTVCSTLELLGVSYAVVSGHLTPLGLFELLSENRNRIIVLDDVSSLLNQPIALQLLLAALGNRHGNSRVRLVRYKTAKGDQVVPFTGGIICISNLPLAGHHPEILAALNDRVYVISFEPSDEQIIALIEHIAETGMQDVTADKALMVAHFLITECKRRGIRPSVRLFVAKAIPDYRLYATGKTEAHWHDLIISNLEQQLVELRQPTRDLSRREQIIAEQNIALEVLLNFDSIAKQVAEFAMRTGKSQATLYRRRDELRKAGRL